METVVQIGAGAIGRGFLAQLWCDAGYETVFVDTDDALVQKINAVGSYRLRLIGAVSDIVRTVQPVRAIWAGDAGAVTDAIATCAFAATAVGARHSVSVAQNIIAPAPTRRSLPLNVLLCENGADVRDDFVRALGNAARPFGVAECVVGRMVPQPQAEGLSLTAESFAELPFNADNWHGTIPSVPGLVAVRGDWFPAYELRKLFLHNGGHALLAYHGALCGYETLTQCAVDGAIIAELRGFWTEVCAAFARSGFAGVPIFVPDALTAFTDDLLARFQQRELGDTVERVARDPRRKLSRTDRLTGAALFCTAQGVEPEHTVRAIAAAMRYDVAEPFAEVAGLPGNHPLVATVENALAKIKAGF